MKSLKILLVSVSFLFSIFSVPAFAQISVVVNLPANANIDNFANGVHGAAQDRMADPDGDGNLLLLSMPGNGIPQIPANGGRSFELNSSTTLPSNPHSGCWIAAPTAAASWYQTQPNFRLINLSRALTNATGRGVTVAIIDSQVDYSHPALAGRLTTGYDFASLRQHGATILNDSSAGYLDDSSAGYLDQATRTYLNDSSAGYLDDSSAGYLDSLNPAWSHATLVAGIIAAVAPDAMIMPVRAFDDLGSSDTFTISKAIVWAVDHGAQVINMSFGTDTSTNMMQKAIVYALNHNVTLVASAGNHNTPVAQWPAAFSGVISTAATDLGDVKASFSNYGPTIVMDAPGVNIISAAPGNLYGCMSGTSFSAPIIAGTAALVRSEGVTSVTQPITSGAINIDAQNPAYTGQLGKRVDVRNSVN